MVLMLLIVTSSSLPGDKQVAGKCEQLGVSKQKQDSLSYQEHKKDTILEGNGVETLQMLKAGGVGGTDVKTLPHDILNLYYVSQK